MKKNPTLTAKLAAKKSRIPHPASRIKQPLSPQRALQNELRTLDKAEDKIISDAVKDELYTESRYNKVLTKLQKDAAALRKSWDKHNAGCERRVGAALRNITSRRNRLQARLAAL